MFLSYMLENINTLEAIQQYQFKRHQSDLLKTWEIRCIPSWQLNSTYLLPIWTVKLFQFTSAEEDPYFNLFSNPLKGQCHEIFDHLYCLYDSTWAPWVNRQNGFANCLFLEKIFDCKVRNLTVNNYVNTVSEQSKTMRTHIFKMYIFNLNFLLLVTHIFFK